MPGGINVLCAWVGSNDLLFGNSAATMIANATQYCALAKDKFDIVLFPALKRDTATPEAEIERAIYNPWVENNYLSIGAKAFSRILDVPEALDPTNAVMFPDGIHPSPTLHALMTPKTIDAIQSIHFRH